VRLTVRLTGLLVFILVVSLAARGEDATAATPGNGILPPPDRISGKVYAWIAPEDAPNRENHGFSLNMAFVVGNDGVAVLDTGYTEEMAEAMLGHIRAITDKPILYVINSNSEPGRFMGNEVFRRHGAKIVAHAVSANRMELRGAEFAGHVEQILELPPGSVAVPGPPDMVITRSTILSLGDLDLYIMDAGAAHTPAHLAVEIPSERVVYAGDILFSGHLLTILPDSDIKSWLQAFDRIRSYGNMIYIPGHGRQDNLVGFEYPTRNYLRLLYFHMVKMIRDGVDMQDAIDGLDQSAYSDMPEYSRYARCNALWAYLQVEEEYFNRLR
jgi:glyoxylase-like metal-dependent hydrolase (beta-lactamase superfamily II)